MAVTKKKKKKPRKYVIQSIGGLLEETKKTITDLTDFTERLEGFLDPAIDELPLEFKVEQLRFGGVDVLIATLLADFAEGLVANTPQEERTDKEFEKYLTDITRAELRKKPRLSAYGMRTTSLADVKTPLAGIACVRDVVYAFIRRINPDIDDAEYPARCANLLLLDALEYIPWPDLISETEPIPPEAG